MRVNAVRWVMMLFLFTVLSAGCKQKIEPGTAEPVKLRTVKVTTGVAQISRQPFIYEAVGTIRAKTESTLSAKLMATVESVKVKEGDVVQKDAMLVVLDPIQADAGLNQASAGLEEAKRSYQAAVSAKNAAAADAELAKATYERYQELLKQHTVSRQEFDEVKARYQAAMAGLNRANEMLKAAAQGVQQAKARQDSAKASRTDTEIRAPYHGVITSKKVEQGDLAAPGTPLIAMESTDGYRAEVFLPESQRQSVSEGQTVRVVIPPKALSAEGVVETIVPSADASSRTFLIKVALPESLKPLHSGMFVRIHIPVSQETVIQIPKTAVVIHGQLTGIFKVDADQRARFRLIRIGREFGEFVEVISGLKDGERYVVTPVPELADGVKAEEAS